VIVRTAPDTRPGRYRDRSEPPAPRQETAYRCDRGHDFAVVLAAEAEPPATWDYCRCGASGQRVSGDKEAVGASAAEEARRERVRLLERLRARRGAAELEQLLADRLAELAATRNGRRAIR
jgi:RNA polymerase-binding protein